MNKWQKQQVEKEDRAKELTLPKLLIRVVFFGAFVALLTWGPWALLPSLLICAGGGLAYMAIARVPLLKRYV